VLQLLDQTIANVALPYMQGSFSASFDEILWVLTSYITASAIMTAPVGWLAARFGRKPLYVGCIIGFTLASMLCGAAQSLGQIVMFRILQGMFGAALVPLSQAVMLDSYALHERAKAMAIWGMGVMMGPIMGPSLGAWLTETYSWHWVFFVNLPFGIFTVLGLMVFLDETRKNRELRFDWFGFLALALNGWAKTNIRIDANAYGSLFFTMTGFHALHVVAGVLLLAALFTGIRLRAFAADHRAGAEAITYYWHFVFIVWVGIWATLYLVR